MESKGAAGVVIALVAVTAAGCGGSASKAAPGATTVAMKLSDKGCSPATVSIPAGPVTFNVSNEGSSKVTEFELKNDKGIILGERENIVEGIDGSFSLTVQPGTYVLSCPNGDPHDVGVLTVDRHALDADRHGVGGSTRQGNSGLPRLRREPVREAAGRYEDVRRGARSRRSRGGEAQFGPVRAYYERIEPVAESFGDLDPAIDARINDVANVNSWTGFHRIERILWEQNTTKGTAPYAKRLLQDVTTLDTKVKTLTYQPAQLANGAVELLNEVAGSKITGEEDRYSHTDLSDFEANVAGRTRRSCCSARHSSSEVTQRSRRRSTRASPRSRRASLPTSARRRSAGRCTAS